MLSVCKQEWTILLAHKFFQLPGLFVCFHSNVLVNYNVAEKLGTVQNALSLNTSAIFSATQVSQNEMNNVTLLILQLLYTEYHWIVTELLNIFFIHILWSEISSCIIHNYVLRAVKLTIVLSNSFRLHHTAHGYCLCLTKM